MKPKSISLSKTIFVIISGIPNLIAPIGSDINIADKRILILPVLVMLILLPFFAEFLHGKIYNFREPDWHDSPFNMNFPLSVFQFYGYVFLVYGLSMVIGTYIKFHQPNFIGIFAVLLSIGTFSAIKFVIEFKKDSKRIQKEFKL
jgi:hypothetical protein